MGFLEKNHFLYLQQQRHTKKSFQQDAVAVADADFDFDSFSAGAGSSFDSVAGAVAVLAGKTTTAATTTTTLAVTAVATGEGLRGEEESCSLSTPIVAQQKQDLHHNDNEGDTQEIVDEGKPKAKDNSLSPLSLVVVAD